MNIKNSFKGIAKNGSELIKPENALFNTWYSITINPPETAVVMETSYAQQCFEFEEEIRGFSTHLMLWPELSQTGRMHYHGIVRFKDKLSLIMFQRLISRKYQVSLDTIDDMPTWIQYCMKNSEVWDDYKDPYMIYQVKKMIQNLDVKFPKRKQESHIDIFR